MKTFPELVAVHAAIRGLPPLTQERISEALMWIRHHHVLVARYSNGEPHLDAVYTEAAREQAVADSRR